MEKRQQYNKLIIKLLSELVDKYPDWRFGQILFNSKVVKPIYDDKDLIIGVNDPFYEESEITFNRMSNIIK